MIQTGGFSLRALPQAPTVAPFFSPTSPIEAFGRGFMGGMERAEDRRDRRRRMDIEERAEERRGALADLKLRQAELQAQWQEDEMLRKEKQRNQQIALLERLGGQGVEPAVKALEGALSSIPGGAEMARTVRGVSDRGVRGALEALPDRTREQLVGRMAEQEFFPQDGLSGIEDEGSRAFNEVARYYAASRGVSVEDASQALRDPEMFEVARNELGLTVRATRGWDGQQPLAQPGVAEGEEGLRTVINTPASGRTALSQYNRLVSRNADAIESLLSRTSLTNAERREIQNINRLAAMINDAADRGIEGAIPVDSFDVDLLEERDRSQRQKVEGQHESLLRQYRERLEPFQEGDRTGFLLWRGPVGGAANLSDTIATMFRTGAVDALSPEQRQELDRAIVALQGMSGQSEKIRDNMRVVSEFVGRSNNPVRSSMDSLFNPR